MNVIIDTDMGADDWLATLLLFLTPNVNVEAITVTGNGLAHLGYGVQHALDLFFYSVQSSNVVGIGTAVPLSGTNTFPDAWRTPTDFFLGIPHAASKVPPSTVPASALLTSLIQNATEPIVLIALGPLTNVATAFLQTPSLASKLQALYIMGGAVNVPGNVPNSTAEYNFFTDPEAASVVIGSGAPITLIPLDVTNLAPIDMDFYAQLGAKQLTPTASLAFQILTAQLDAITQNQYFFWDPLAAAVAINPNIVGTKSMNLAVLTSGPNAQDYGSLIQDPSAPAIQVAQTVDTAALQSLVLQTYNRSVLP